MGRSRHRLRWSSTHSIMGRPRQRHFLECGHGYQGKQAHSLASSPTWVWRHRLNLWAGGQGWRVLLSGGMWSGEMEAHGVGGWSWKARFGHTSSMFSALNSKISLAATVTDRHTRIPFLGEKGRPCVRSATGLCTYQCIWKCAVRLRIPLKTPKFHPLHSWFDFLRGLPMHLHLWKYSSGLCLAPILLGASCQCALKKDLSNSPFNYDF